MPPTKVTQNAVIEEIRLVREDIHELDKKFVRLDQKFEDHCAIETMRNDAENMLKIEMNGDTTHPGIRAEHRNLMKQYNNGQIYKTDFRLKLSTGLIILILTVILNAIATIIITHGGF